MKFQIVVQWTSKVCMIQVGTRYVETRFCLKSNLACSKFHLLHLAPQELKCISLFHDAFKQIIRELPDFPLIPGLLLE